MTNTNVVVETFTGNIDTIRILEDPNSRERGQCGLDVTLHPRCWQRPIGTGSADAAPRLVPSD